MITINYCGYHTHNPDCDLIYRPVGSNDYLFLLVLSPMIFHFPGNSVQKAPPGTCILYTPEFYQHYQAEKEFFNSFVHFSCPADLLSQFILPVNKLFYPRNTEELHWILKNIYREFCSPLSKSDLLLDSYIQQLLIQLHRDQLQECFRSPQHSGQPNNLYSEMLALRQQMLGRCELDWNIEKLCQMLNIGHSQFYHYYEQFFHSTPRQELIQARLQKAKYLLSNDAVTIKQAAYASGFENIYHFNRLFKTNVGCTPGEYRRQTTSPV